MSDPVTAIEVPAPSGARRLDGPDVVLYPSQGSGDRGTYSLDAAGFVDDLVAEGVSARLYHDLLHSDWSSDEDPTVLTLVLGIASAAGWAATKRLLGTRTSGTVDVTVGFRQGEEVRWVRAAGAGPAVADALDR